MRVRVLVAVCACAAAAIAQVPVPAPAPAGEQAAESGLKQPEPAKPGMFVLEPGTRIPLALINSVSTKHSAEGDRVYLETVFPVVVDGRVIVPPGSYVQGTITEIKRPGRIKGRGELFVRFDSMTLPNGVTRDFRARVGALDGQASEELDKGEGKVRSEGNKSGDARTIGEAASTGASVGVIAGGASGGHYGMGAGIGAAAGAAAGLIGVLLTRGPDAVLARGSTLEMVLDRTLAFSASEIDFSNVMPSARVTSGPGPLPSQKQQRRGVPMPGRLPM